MRSRARGADAHDMRLSLILISLVAMAIMPAVAQAATPRHQLLVDINHARAAHGLAPVRPLPALHLAAQSHSIGMMQADYFAHTSPGGRTVFDRIFGTGLTAGHAWQGAETLVWGTGSRGSPAAAAAAWMASPEHRAIMLSPTYRNVGIARECGAYQGQPRACVWSAEWLRVW
jgi:uncharacterized protein YkwD